MDRIKKMFCALVLFVIMNIGLANAMVFPIAIDDCLMSRGRVELTGWYNQTRYDDNDGTTRKHKALDIPCVLGTAIRAARAGKVIEFGFDSVE